VFFLKCGKFLAIVDKILGVLLKKAKKSQNGN
jgi:hypothetical protein